MIEIGIDADVPLKGTRSPNSVPERVRAYANTARLLAAEGLDVTPDGRDEREAASIATQFAADPEKAAKNVTDKHLTTLTSASLIQADAILTEFGKQVVHSTTALRHTITNKLLLETENPDPRIRLKALELLGKVSDVGLFAEKTEITVTHQTSDELRETLRQKLEQLRQPPVDRPPTNVTITDADFEEVFADEPLEAAAIDDADEDEDDTQDLSSIISSFDDEDD